MGTPSSASTEPTPCRVRTHTSAHLQHLHHSSPYSADASDMSADISSNTPMTMARPAFHNRHCHCCRSTPKAMRRQRHSRCAGWARRRRLVVPPLTSSCRAHNDAANDSFRHLQPLALDESAQAPPVCLQLAAIKAGALPSFRRLRFII